MTQDGCTYDLAIPLDFTHTGGACSTRADCHNPFTDLCVAGACVKPECLYSKTMWGPFYADCACRTLGTVGGVCAERYCKTTSFYNGACPVGHVCDEDTCVPPDAALVGASCSSTLSSSGCEPGALCDSGTCRWSCLVGDPGPHCPAGDVCTSGVCRAAADFVALGASCSVEDAPCAPTDGVLIGFCQGGTCVVKCDENTDCKAGEICDVFHRYCVPTLCGNGVIDDDPLYGETCDDHNQTDGDGCSRYCETEPAPLSSCSAPTVVTVGTQTIALTAGLPPMDCDIGHPVANDYGATLRLAAPGLGRGNLTISQSVSGATSWPQVATLDGCPGTADAYPGSSYWNSKETGCTIWFEVKGTGTEVLFAVRSKTPTATVKIDFDPHSCDGTELSVGDTVLTGPESDVLVTPSEVSGCAIGGQNRRLAYFVADKTGDVTLTMKTKQAGFRALEGCPSWTAIDLGCALYGNADLLPPSVVIPVTAGQRYSVITYTLYSNIDPITVHRAGP